MSEPTTTPEAADELPSEHSDTGLPDGYVPVGAIRHPLNPRAYYIPEGDGTVRVTMGTRTGVFTANGRYLQGTMFEADPELCVWVAAPRPSGHHRISRVVEMPAER